TANPASRLYGAADPTFTATISGFANGETLASSGVSGSASLSSNDTATSPVGGTYTITAALGSLVANNYDFTTFVTAALTVDQAQLTPVLTATGTSGADTVAITFSSTADFSITINGTTSSYSTENINQIIVDGMGGGDTLTVSDPYNTGTGTFSPQTLQWNSTKFQIQAKQTQNIVFNGIQNDSAVLDGDTGADVATLTTNSVELAGPQAVDNKAVGFGSAQANAGSSSATASIDDDANGGAVVGSAAQTSLSGTGYNYVASGFQHVTATSAFATNTAQLNASTGYTASNQPGTSTLTNSGGTQVIVATGFNNPQYFVQSGPGLTATGTIGADTVAITFSSAADFSITVNGTTNSYSTENINQIIVDGMGGGDTLTVSDPYNTGTGTFSPQTLQWNSAKFQIQANQTQNMVFNGIQNDSAVLDGDTGADVATLTTSSAELAGPQAFDNKAVGFGSAQANAGSSSATASIDDDVNGGAVVGSAAQTSLSGTGYNYVASGFQYVSATSAFPTNTAQLNASTGYTASNQPGTSIL
ncbi:MAG TPA: MBG domain-containing protein, partial [Pirellulales bacterium]